MVIMPMCQLSPSMNITCKWHAMASWTYTTNGQWIAFYLFINMCTPIFKILIFHKYKIYNCCGPGSNTPVRYHCTIKNVSSDSMVKLWLTVMQIGCLMPKVHSIIIKNPHKMFPIYFNVMRTDADSYRFNLTKCAQYNWRMWISQVHVTETVQS